MSQYSAKTLYFSYSVEGQTEKSWISNVTWNGNNFTGYEHYDPTHPSFDYYTIGTDINSHIDADIIGPGGNKGHYTGTVYAWDN